MSPRAGVPAPHEPAGVGGAAATVVAIDAAGSTPILEEYRRIKAELPDAIVLARLGDFYEMFGADALEAAPLLGVTLTGRTFGAAGRLPMCGVPHHAVTGHIRRLLDSGRRVALWDQVGEAVPGRLVRRAVTRVLSPGTASGAEYLDETRVARCAALHSLGGRTGLAAVDVSSGELTLLELTGGVDSPAVREECERLDIAELLVMEGAAIPEDVLHGVLRTVLPPAHFDEVRAGERLMAAGGARRLEALGVDDCPRAVAAAGAVLAYCERARIGLEPGFVRVRRRVDGVTMRLDAQTRRNLELLQPLGAGATSLAALLDRTRTPMGARLLRARLREPLIDPVAINARLDAVEELVGDRRRRDRLGEALGAVRDLERLVGRCVQRSAGPRDLAAVRRGCHAIPALADLLEGCGADELVAATARCTVPEGLGRRLSEVLVDDPPATARDGGCVRPGADAALDGLLAAGAEARAYVAGLEGRERERTGIATLRVGYNRVFGYYIEVSNNHRGAVPGDYVRKQTLVGAERYVTGALKEQEAVVLSTRERCVARERELLDELVDAVAADAATLLAAATAVATIDLHRSLACVAVDGGWVRPEVDASLVLDIEAGRHPLVEHALGDGRFVANDCRLDAAERVVVLTGPNMAGKSTWLRQVALIALLAQVGSMVPAARARVGVCDRIFTRIGAQDDLAAGLSTFMVEMSETAAILRQATARSLVILDEIGRGTSTDDGLCIAQAVVEHLHDAPHLGCRTLFATHFHELTSLAGALPRLRNARVEVLEQGDDVVFLHRIVDGGADRSYGIHVARLAGVPQGVVVRARQLLAELEATRPPAGRGEATADQLTLNITAPGAHALVSELAQLDIEQLTPLDALNKLAELRQRAET